ncbi:MAG TPA: NlpC/P60 family protein [Spirochaetota bacterium]|nr:NlpC/P60 family protein [Spirochaetota bacterium]
MNANRYIDIPFAERGRSRAGVDCWGLVCLVYREEYGIELPDYLGDDYTTTDGPLVSGLIARHKAESWWPLAPGMEAEGDVILLRMRGLPSHVGLVIRSGRMLHVERGRNVCVERYWGPMWNKRVMGCYRHADR